MTEPPKNTITIKDATVTVWLDPRGHPIHIKINAIDYHGDYKVNDE